MRGASGFAVGLSAAALSVLGQELSISPPPSHDEPVSLDSGWRAPTAAPGPQVLWSGTVYVEGARWLRLAFSDVVLPGDPAREDAARIRLTSMEDGAVQEFTSESLARWSASSAYFNGEAVFVELIGWAGSGTGGDVPSPARVRVVRATAGDVPFTSRSICGPTDDRVLSSDPKCARYLPAGCTSWLINDGNHQFLTAGHCGVADGGICEFNVPLSNADGSLRHPDPVDQYPVEPTSVQTTYTGIGNDFSYFGCWPNSSGATAYSRQGATFIIPASVPSASGQTLRITGYGTTSAPVPNQWNQVQKTHTGPYTQLSGTTVAHRVDTTGGNSGSPIQLDGSDTAIGVHTNAGCNSTGGQNTGTSLDNVALRNALANPRGICVPGFGVVVPPVYAAGDATRQFGTVSYQTGTFSRIAVSTFSVDGMAFDPVRGVFWVCGTDRTLARINPDTGATTVVGTLSGSSRSASGLAFDPYTDTLYGIIQVGGRLVSINTTTAAVTPLGAPGGNNVGALEFDTHTRTIYGIDDATGGSRLIRIDAVTGLQTVVGLLGAGIADCNGLAYNPADRMLYTINAANEQLLRVNPATGAATVVGPTGTLWGSTCGLACTGPNPVCPADFNGDGFQDFFDYDDFVNCFEAGACPPGKTADFNGDGFADFFDYDDFVAAFEAGC